MDQEVLKSLEKGVLEETDKSPDEFISTVFLTPKPDGNYRMILNLRTFNKCVEYNKFKMDTLQSILKLISPECYMATIDLRDAYYTVPIEEQRKYLRFCWKNKIYQYTCFPNGLS